MPDLSARYLTERLVRLDLAIEELDGWANEPEDLEELHQLERLRDEVRTVLEGRRARADLHERLADVFAERGRVTPASIEPRD
jgi:hypothetical protein